MPATSAQLLAAVPSLADGGATALNPTPNLCNATAVLSVSVLRSVAAGSSPRPMSGTINLNITIVAIAAQTLGGVVTGHPAIGVVSVAAGALSGSYNPANDPGVGLIPYGGVVGNNGLMYGPPPELSIPLASLGMPTSLANAASWQSPPIYNFGLRHVTWAVTSSQTVNLNLTRYADRQGIASIGAVTATATASSAMALDNHDGSGFLSFSIGATNTSGSTATLSSFALLLSAT